MQESNTQAQSSERTLKLELNEQEAAALINASALGFHAATGAGDRGTVAQVYQDALSALLELGPEGWSTMMDKIAAALKRDLAGAYYDLIDTRDGSVTDLMQPQAVPSNLS